MHGLYHKTGKYDLFICRGNNGFDTLLEFKANGLLIEHISLAQPQNASSYAPYRQGPIADWATDGKIALALNRLGEILVFRDKKLLFARRSGKWHFLTHEPVITQMGKAGNKDVRRAVYETCLDASFARTGACIGVVISTHSSKWKAVVTDPRDRIEAASSTKTKALKKMIVGKTFQELDRRHRQELVAIDGATLIDHHGKVLAIGAILKIPGGSTGGGRRAAAMALSELGLGIKVSQDGGINGFHNGNNEATFSVM